MARNNRSRRQLKILGALFGKLLTAVLLVALSYGVLAGVTGVMRFINRNRFESEFAANPSPFGEDGLPKPVDRPPSERLPLEGLVFVLDPGHGGSDEGEFCELEAAPEEPAETDDLTGTEPPAQEPQLVRVTEADTAYAVAEAAAALLRAQGAQVYLTRRADGTPEAGAADLTDGAAVAPTDAERTALADTYGADFFLSLHGTPAPETADQTGGEEGAAFEGLRLSCCRDCPGEEEAAELLGLMAVELGRETGETPPVRRLARNAAPEITRGTRAPAGLLELGCLTDPAQAAVLSEETYAQALAQAVCGAFLKFYGI